MSVSSSRFGLASAALMGLLCCASVSSQAQITVYSNDFNSGSTAGFSSADLNIATRVGNTGNTVRFLGDPNGLYGFGAGTATLNLTNAALVGNVTVAFDLYMIGSQDGNGPAGGGPDPWGLTANGSSLILTNFANFAGSGNTQAFVSVTNFTGNMATPGTGSDASLAGQLGFGTGNFGDSTYHLAFTFANATPTLALSFFSRENEGASNEGWGLDNLNVTSDFKPAAVPEPGSIAMLVGLSMTGAGILSRRRRK